MTLGSDNQLRPNSPSSITVIKAIDRYSILKILTCNISILLFYVSIWHIRIFYKLRYILSSLLTFDRLIIQELIHTWEVIQGFTGGSVRFTVWACRRSWWHATSTHWGSRQYIFPLGCFLFCYPCLPCCSHNCLFGKVSKIKWWFYKLFLINKTYVLQIVCIWN